MPADYFIRNFPVRSSAAKNRDVLEANFMELHMFKRFAEIDGLLMFHQDEEFMSKSQLA
jgi:hypothetical protein